MVFLIRGESLDVQVFPKCKYRLEMLQLKKKQAEAEVVPSSSLVEVEVGVGVEVWVEVGGVRFGAGLTFPVGGGGGWRFGE